MINKKDLVQEDVYLFNTGEAQRAYLTLGCHYIEETKEHRFCVWAPNASSVSVIGDFNGWDGTKNVMERCEGGVFCRLHQERKAGRLI